MADRIRPRPTWTPRAARAALDPGTVVTSFLLIGVPMALVAVSAMITFTFAR
jgi:hypothetical protein